MADKGNFFECTMMDMYLEAPYIPLNPELYTTIFDKINCLIQPDNPFPVVAHCICAALHGGPQQQLQYFSQYARGGAVLHCCIDEHLYPHMSPDTSEDLIQSGLLLCRRHDDFARLFFAHATSEQLALAQFMPPDRKVRLLIASMAGLLSLLRPRLLVSWHPVGVPPLDTSLWAALLAGVPRILLRFNSTSPVTGSDAHRMPYWLTEQMRFLVHVPQVELFANSYAGALSLSEWLELKHTAIPVIPNGFDTSRVQSSKEEQRAFRARFGIPPEAPLLAGVFRLNACKNLEAFAEVTKNILTQIPDLHIIHAGGGPCADEFSQLLAASGVRKCTSLLGAVNEKEIDLLLSSADVLLSPSQREGLSNVWLESMYHRTVPVVSAVGDASRVILHEKCGFVHPQDKLDDMAASVVKLFRDAPLRRRMAAAGHAHVMQHYPLEKFAHALEEKIRRALQSDCR